MSKFFAVHVQVLPQPVILTVRRDPAMFTLLIAVIQKYEIFFPEEHFACLCYP